MADTFEMQHVHIDLGAFTGAGPQPCLYLPEDSGAITIFDAKAVGNGAGTSIGLKLIKMTNVGTPAASGTIGSAAGTVVWAAGVKADVTISSAVVDPGTTGCWIGVEQTSGTCPALTSLSLAYVQGR